jgi:dextranase
MVHSATIVDVTLDRTFYRPGESVTLSIQIHCLADEPVGARVTVAISHLADSVDELSQELDLANGGQTAEVIFKPPPDAPRGYGIDVCLETNDGARVACRTTAFDVLHHWAQTPRYGFLSDFGPGRSDASQVMGTLSRYRINGLQFYDWMYRHEQLLTGQEPYRDPLGRQLSRATVESLIAAAHERNIAAMPYTAIYAASVSFYEEHPDWALYQGDGTPYLFGEDFLVYMDPRRDSPWVAHLLAQFDEVLRLTEFDGIHLDQYGAPKEAYDVRGLRFDLAEPLADTINATKELVRSRRSRGTVVFNAVTNWPIEVVAPADQDFVYIEVWPPYVWYGDLHTLITQAQALGGGKPVVLAAYIDPSLEHNVRLVDAVIFGSGGGHIELGEHNGMLADAYFPRYGTMAPELANVMQRYYEFAVRYQDVIGPRTVDATHSYLNRIEVEGISTSPSQLKDKVWPIVREAEGLTALSLVNLLGVNSPEWLSELDGPPTPLGPTTVRVLNVDRGVNRVWSSSPDTEDISPQQLAFEVGVDQVLAFEIPSLAYWNLIVIEWAQ